MFREFWEKVFINLFAHFSRKVYIFILILHKKFSYFNASWSGDGYKWRVICLQIFQKKKCRGMFALILRILFIFEIFQISLAIKKSSKFNLFFISKFKFDRAHKKILNDTHLKVIKVNDNRDTKQQSKRCFNDKYCR